MAIKEKVEERWIVVRNIIQERQNILEEKQKAVREMVSDLRSSWKTVVIKGVDTVFCFVVETLEGAFSRFNDEEEEVG